jgi:hypothetical protein
MADIARTLWDIVRNENDIDDASGEDVIWIPAGYGAT